MRETSRRGLRITAALGFALLLLAVIVAGCSSKEQQPPVEDVIAPPPVETAPEDDGIVVPAEPDFTAPLTGLKQDTAADKRAIAVMINNMSKARPQSGLPHADMVWEVLAEGGITRLVAIFQSDDFPDAIGPIRSIRPYLIELGETYGGLLVHAGGSPDAYAILQKQKKPYLDEITNAGSYYWRDKSRKAPHNLYSNLEKLRQGADKKNYKTDVPVPVYPFAEEGATAGGSPATQVGISFLLKNYKVSYAYDPATRLYARSINDKPHTDLTTEKQLTTTNIVVLGAKQTVYDDIGRLKIDLESGGPAMLVQLGQAVDCTWERSGDGVIRIMKDGKELPFVPGKTYYHIVPMKPTFAEHITIS
ncbi:DUF3048 domain-containing protein [Paenibacillus mendelii]|uniref:DUF3048 domain-containing protein n=1 Tax=Paenibacillus mendelii TaxID=206163 RepID=A0ABV6JCL7_9BACL|nr:DUF3048 domain-containing protein [Paenibacillus mendelii]MCQ6561640.1 DUF3048 domain-containing protein [Paenibacillus mendelii]